MAAHRRAAMSDHEDVDMANGDDRREDSRSPARSAGRSDKSRSPVRSLSRSRSPLRSRSRSLSRKPASLSRSPIARGVSRSRSRSKSLSRRRSLSRDRRRRSPSPYERRRSPLRRRSPSPRRYRSRSYDRYGGGGGGGGGGYARRRSPPRYRSPVPRRRSPYGGGYRRGRSPPPRRRSRATPPKTGLHLFVAGLNFNTTEKEVQRKFEKYGDVTLSRIVRNPVNGESRGFGFVDMKDDEGADEAIKNLDGEEWHGRRLLVERARNVR